MKTVPTSPRPFAFAVTRAAARVLIALLPALVLLATLGPGCAWQEPDLSPAAQGEPVFIGVPLPLTGATAAFGEIKRNAYEMAEDEINASGGIDGRPLDLIFRDTAGDPDTAAAVTEELVTVDRVILLVGGYSSSCSASIAGVAQEHGIPYLVDSAAADSITRHEWDYVFRLCPPAALYARGLAGFLAEVAKPASLAIIYERSEFGSSVATAMAAWCAENRIAVPVRESYEPGTIDFTPILDQVRESDPDVVYVVAYLTEASLIIRQAREQGLTPNLFAGGAAGFVLPQFVRNTGRAAENIVTAALWAPTAGYPGALAFAETYRARYGEYPTYHGAEAYAATFVAAEALLRAASTDPERLRVALADTELMTAFGPVSFQEFDGYTNQNACGTIVLQILGGVHRVIWPPEAAAADYVFPDPAAETTPGP